MFEVKQLHRTLTAALRDITHPGEEIRLGAVRDLGRLARQAEGEAIAALERALASDVANTVRAEAALALADGECRSSVGSLISAAQDPEPRVRQLVLVALGELASGQEDHLKAALEGAFRSSLPALRFQALMTRHSLGLDEEGAHKVEALGDADPKVRYLALRLAAAQLENVSSAARGESLAERVLPAAEVALGDSDPAVRTAAAMLIVPRPSKLARRNLVSALNEGLRLAEPQDQEQLIQLAGELSLSAAKTGLERQAFGRLGVFPGPFAWQARVALARIGHARAERTLLKGLKSANRDVRILAVVACGRARLQAARAPVTALLAKGKVAPDVAQAALENMRSE